MHGSPVVGWLTTNGRPFNFVASNDEVDTVQVILDNFSTVSQDGRYLNNKVDDEKRVNPVSEGDFVGVWKNWNLLRTPRVSNVYGGSIKHKDLLRRR